MKNKERYNVGHDQGIGYFLEHFKQNVGAEMLWKLYKHWAEQEEKLK